VTAGLLAVDDQGNPDPSMAPATEMHDEPGFADTWFDLKSKSVSST
jgi:peptide/nickel transport system ATP-binding protein/oligopeptide transport system ATP-binding protein